jgi:cytochrome c biogenesis protein CcdA
MQQVLFGSALLISFLGGVVALLAPCCVPVMLPAFFATGFGRRTGIAAATALPALARVHRQGRGRRGNLG